MPFDALMVWLVLLLFIAIQLGIGMWASRRVKSEEDFFVAGRRLGTPLVALSLFATWFGAETCLGSSGAVYEEGLSGARADPFGYFFCLLFLGIFLARRLHNGGFLTLGDLFRARFGARTERLAVILLVPSGLVWGAAQIRAFGQVLASTTELPVLPAVWIAASVSVVYTFFGGLLGDVVTDAIQGIIVILGLCALCFYVALDLPNGVLESASLSSERLLLVGEGETILSTLDRWSVPILGSLVAQELVSRVLAARTGATAVKGSLFASGLYLLVGGLPVFLGLVGGLVEPSLDHPEQLLIALADRYLGEVWGLVFTLSLLCAILSTVDSILLSTSALVSHNLIEPLLARPSERIKLGLGRGVVVLSGLFCTVVALHAESIYSLVETASSLGTAGILIVTFAGLYDPRPCALAALASLCVGALSTPTFEFWNMDAPYISSVLLALFVYLVVRLRLLGKRAPSIESEAGGLSL